MVDDDLRNTIDTLQATRQRKSPRTGSSAETWKRSIVAESEATTPSPREKNKYVAENDELEMIDDEIDFQEEQKEVC